MRFYLHHFKNNLKNLFRFKFKKIKFKMDHFDSKVKQMRLDIDAINKEIQEIQQVRKLNY